ncbi:MAG TPA: hypothetical protein VHB79_38275 [Polyangiaceae bacterium]|nr:hypothetical protein [Polyangiaceae bacterium]
MKSATRKPVSIGVALLSLGLGACGLKDAWDDHQRAETALKAELGLTANVAVNIINGHTSVSVHLPAAPTGDASNAKRAITEVVTRACHLKVEHVEISY